MFAKPRQSSSFGATMRFVDAKTRKLAKRPVSKNLKRSDSWKSSKSVLALLKRSGSPSTETAGASVQLEALPLICHNPTGTAKISSSAGINPKSKLEHNDDQLHENIDRQQQSDQIGERGSLKVSAALHPTKPEAFPNSSKWRRVC